MSARHEPVGHQGAFEDTHPLQMKLFEREHR